MKISYDTDYFNIDELLSLRPCYWDKQEKKWLHIDSDIENGRFVLETKHTTAVGFLDPELVAAATKDNSNKKEESITEEKVNEETLQTMYERIMIGAVLFILLLVGVAFFLQTINANNSRKRVDFSGFYPS